MLHEIGDVDALGLDVERAGADAAELEGVAHEAFEPLGLVGDRLEQLAPLLGSMRDHDASRVPAAAFTAVSGVRRLWLTAERKPARCRPTSATSRASRTSSCRRRRSTPAASPATSASSSSRSAGVERSRRAGAASVTPGPSTRTLARAEFVGRRQGRRPR